DISRADDALNFKGRIKRENWVKQAKTLASGGETEFSKRAK
ncbi:MAG TPA: NADH:quinone oxidoreductase, partial [Rhizobiales bacterium]|nr:NADH:quinone oxidoreductase [Hyphomicrobiales bacterium]